jgi:hypothetical protein
MMDELPTMKDELRWAVVGPPIGTWRTVQGTADILMQDTLCLLSDGTGYLQSQSVLRSVERFSLMWKQVQTGTLSMTILYPEDDPDEEPLWETFLYCTAVIQIDAGGAAVSVLRNVDNEQFWILCGPIGFVSPVLSAAG